MRDLQCLKQLKFHLEVESLHSTVLTTLGKGEALGGRYVKYWKELIKKKITRHHTEKLRRVQG